MNQLKTVLGLFGLCLCAICPPIALNYGFFHESWNVDLGAAIGLLLINFGFFVAFSKSNSKISEKWGPAYGVFLVVVKLFVNTFTIFLFIGLQAVRTHVFVPEFFAGYSLLLFGGVLFLHSNSKRF